MASGQSSVAKFSNLGVDDGLSHSLVTSMVEDDKGFLWIGTLNGLNSYDGYEFKKYYAGNSNKTPNKNYIVDLYKDRFGQIWIHYREGIDRLNPETGIFHKYIPNLSEKDSLSSDRDPIEKAGLKYTRFFEDDKNQLWIASDKGINKYNRNTNTFASYQFELDNENSLSDNNITIITEDKFGYLWVGTEDGLNRIEKATGEVKRVFSSSTNPETNVTPLISKIYFNDDGSIWLGTLNMGLVIIENPYDKNTPINYTNWLDFFPSKILDPSIFEIFKTSTGKVLIGATTGLFDVKYEKGVLKSKKIEAVQQFKTNNIIEDDNGFIWISSGADSKNNIYRFNQDLKEYSSFGNDKSSDDNFKNEPVNFIKKGNNGLIFIGTLKGGLYKVDINAKKFRQINSNPLNKLHIFSNDVYSIYEDSKNNLWVGTTQELNVINTKTGNTKNFKNYTNIKNNISYEYSKNLDAKLIGVIKETKDGKFWLGSFDYKVSLYDPKKSTFLNFHENPKDEKSFTGWSIRTICVTKSGETYFGGTTAGLTKLNKDSLTFKHYAPKNNDDGPSDIWINSIIEDKDSLLWLGTFKGINSFNTKTEKFTHYQDNTKTTNGSENNVISILEPQVYGNNILWLGTDSGLKKFNKKTGSSELFTTENGLPNNTVLGILEDDDGFLWLSTLNGLAKFNTTNNTIRNYSKEDGLQSNEFNEGACFKNSVGVMYFGGSNGITYFNPKEIKDNQQKGSVILTRLKVNQQYVNANDTINQKVILKKSLPYTKELNFTNKDKFISFEFSSTNFIAPNDIKYRYKLEGYDEAWNVVNSNQRFANFSGLRSGEYNLIVDCTNSDGVWSGEPTTLKINYLPPFWEKSWFIITLIIAIFSIIGLYFQIHTRNLKTQKKLLEKEVQEQTAELIQTNKNLAEKNKKIIEMSEQLHESDEMKLRFFTNISHEFRTPLTLILSPAEKLINLSNFTDSNVVKDNLKIIHRNSKHLYNLINQLLDIRKISSGNLKLSVSKNNIIFHLSEIFNLFKDYAKSNNITLIFSTEINDLKGYFDSDIIEKILFNLLSNAIKYTPKGGIVKLIVSKTSNKEDEKAICFSIKDSGKGIPENELKHIFERFYQIEKKSQTGQISTGIGLSFVKELVDIHKGKIKVDSKINYGTTFSVFLSLNKEKYISDEISTISSIENPYLLNYSKNMLSTFDKKNNKLEVDYTEKETPNIKIVIVEDNIDLLSFLTKELKEYYEVLTATDGKEGLEIINKHIPNLIISDIMMPKMDGVALCKKIKSNINTSHIPVFLLTAKSEQEHQISGLDSGADDYITKPFNIEALKLRIENALNSRRIILEKFSSTLKPIPEGINISELDHNLLESIVEYVENNIDSEITGDILAQQLGLSKSNLYKKLKDLTGISVNIFIRNIRLNVAAKLLEKGNYSISEVAYAIGFNNPKYFSSCFKEYFNTSPRNYMIGKK